MTRLEFQKLGNVDEMKEVLNALIQGKEYLVTYKDKEGNTQKKVLCKNGKLFLGQNYSISLSIAPDKNYYIGIDYFTLDDKIKLFQSKTNTKNLF